MKAIKILVFVVFLLIPTTNIHALDLIQPQTDPECQYELLSFSANRITLRVNGETFTIESSFSMPNGYWMTSTFPYSFNYFNHGRTVDARKGYIHITDTFTNLTAGPLPIMQRHTSNLVWRMTKAWVACRTDISSIEESANPTSYAITENAGIGFMALSDEMQVHVKNYSSNGILGIADNNCVIPQGGTYSVEWVIVPTQRPDFWDFVNACRRIRDVNFTLSHQVAFLPTGPLTNSQIRKMRNKSATVFAVGLNDVAGVKAHGTLFQKYLELYPDVYADHNDFVRSSFPGVKPLVYFHCYLDNSNPEDLAAYVDDRTLLADGSQATYGGGERPRIFFSTAGNKWGEAMAKNVDSILGVAAGDCKASGVYWDGFNWGSRESKYHYGQPWDNISGDINENTGQLLCLKSSTLLLGREWIVSQIQRIMSQGTLLSNSQPHIRSIYNLHFQSFQESASAMNYARALLYSPVLIGDHLTETEFIDAYRGMVKALNYGCLYNWYEWTILPIYETLTKYMFPITPIELREGYIIGEERIVTNRSGTYGWGDNSMHEVHVFGADGREMPNVGAPTKTLVRVNGKTYTQLQLAEYETAAIIRHPPAVPWLNLLLRN